MKASHVLFILSSLVWMNSPADAQPSSMNILAGMDRGGVAVGANFDINDTANEAYGGYARIFSKDKSEGEAGLVAFGAEFRGQQKFGLFEYYLTPGFGVISRTFDNTKILFGPTLALGVTAELDKNSSIGVENTKIYSWIGKYKGLMKDAFLANYKVNFN